MQFIISLIITGIITTGAVLQSEKQNQTIQNIEEALPIKESILVSLERTPCFGKCPTYKYSIFNTGRIIYHGEANVENLGSYSARLSDEQVKEIITQIEVQNIFAMNDKYDAKITDIPSTLLIINLNGKKKKIFDRHGAPNALKDFEKFIDRLVLNSKMIKTDNEENGD